MKLFKSIKINDEGTDLILSLLTEPLFQFSDVFDRSLNDTCCLKSPDPIIEFSAVDTQPFQCKVRKHSPRDKQMMSEQVEKLLKQGVIDKSKSVEGCPGGCTEALWWLSHGRRLQACEIVYKDGRLPCAKRARIGRLSALKAFRKELTKMR